MGKSYYIAYGSNLSVEQMAVRCPDAKVVGTAMLDDWELLFRVHATIAPRKGAKVPVAVWEISEKDEKKLDLYEGFPTYYKKRNLKVKMTRIDNSAVETVDAMVYIMNLFRGFAPSPSYYKIIDEGYQRFGFDRRILRQARKEAKDEEFLFS